jgi:hypothetical protein
MPSHHRDPLFILLFNPPHMGIMCMYPDPELPLHSCYVSVTIQKCTEVPHAAKCERHLHLSFQYKMYQRVPSTFCCVRHYGSGYIWRVHSCVSSRTKVECQGHGLLMAAHADDSVASDMAWVYPSVKKPRLQGHWSQMQFHQPMSSGPLSFITERRGGGGRSIGPRRVKGLVSGLGLWFIWFVPKIRVKSVAPIKCPPRHVKD